MAKNILNVAVIGVSKAMGQIHMDGIKDIPGIHIYAICDNATDGRLEECKEKYNPERAVKDYKELLDDENIDAAIIVTPDQLHCEMTCAFLRAGKDVMCEKPMALSLEECEEMMRVEKETGRRLMIGQICRFTDNFIKAKELIDAGEIGELYFVESEYAHDYITSRGYNDWRLDPRRYGLLGGGVHAIDLLRWIVGSDPVETYALHTHKVLLDWPTPDSTIAILKFPGEINGKVYVSTGCKRPYTMRSVFYGTKGTIICDNTSDHITYYKDDEKHDYKHEVEGARKISAIVNNHNTGGEGQMFADALLHGKDVPIVAMEGAKTVAVAMAIIESANTGKAVQIKYPEV